MVFILKNKYFKYINWKNVNDDETIGDFRVL